MKNILLILVLIVPLSFTYAQDVAVQYCKGQVDVDGMMIDFVIKTEQNKGQYNSFLYLPGSFIYGQDIKETVITDDSLKFISSKLKAKLFCSYDQGNIDAQWHQGGQIYDVDMDFVNEEEVAFLQRPQTPIGPFPYIEKDICIENTKGGSTLCGTLSLPDDANDYPLVIMITGSGAQDRNEEIGGHKPFLVIADHLTKCGYAVFRYDDRGFGKSKGDMRNATSYDLMTDATAVLHFFGDYPNIDSENIGIIGHSEGGMIAWMLGAKYPKDVAYIISLAGPGVNIQDLMLKQTIDVNIAAGIEEEDLVWIAEMQKETYQIAMNSKNSIEIREQITALYDKYGENLSDEKKIEYGMSEANINAAVMQLSSPWLKYFLQFEPSKYLKKIKCPILALNGTRDVQVDAEQNLRGIEEAINPKKCKELEIHKLEGLNHLFQAADDGTVQEYFYLQETFSMDALRVIEDFMNRHN